MVVAWKWQNCVTGCHRFQLTENYQADDIARKTLLSHLKISVSFHLVALSYHVLAYSQGCLLHNLKMTSTITTPSRQSNLQQNILSGISFINFNFSIIFL